MDRDSLGVSNVEEFSVGLGVFDQGDHGIHDAAHPSEGATLRAVTIDGQGLSRQRLPQDARDDHPILPGLGGPMVLEMRMTTGGSPFSLR